MKVLVSGASGLVGACLVPHLRARGHQVVTLVRRAPTSAAEVSWDPAAGVLDPAALSGVEAAVHLSGAGVGDHRWTPSYRQEILRSRVDSTRLLARSLAHLDPLPQALVSSSGVDYYPDSAEPMTEDSPGGSGFLADVCRAWEAAADPARDAGIRVAVTRTSLVLGRRGGIIGRLLPLVRMGLAGPLGSGRQWWSWIALPDHVRALTLLVEGPPAGNGATGRGAISGPVNLASPSPVRQLDFVRALAHEVHRPALLPAPTAALRLALGQFAGTVVANRRIVPQRLLDAGFVYEYPDLTSAARWVTQR